MNTSQYNYFINNEPNFQTLKEWENDHIDVEFITEKNLDASHNYDMLFAPIEGLDLESDFLNSLKVDHF